VLSSCTTEGWEWEDLSPSEDTSSATDDKSCVDAQEDRSVESSFGNATSELFSLSLSRCQASGAFMTAAGDEEDSKDEDEDAVWFAVLAATPFRFTD
jgi:hypothetical protein